MQLSKLLERWFPHPFVSFLIIIFWLMLSHSLDASDLLMAVILGLVIPRYSSTFYYQNTAHPLATSNKTIFCCTLGYCYFQFSCCKTGIRAS